VCSLGYKLSEIAGTNLSFLLQGSNFDLIDELKNAAKIANPTRFSLTSLTKSGIPVVNRMCWKPVKDQHNSTHYLLGIMRQITSFSLQNEDHEKHDRIIHFLPNQLIV
jgi:hypothetical protein